MRKRLHLHLQGVQRLAGVDRGRRSQSSGYQIDQDQPGAGKGVHLLTKTFLLLHRWTQGARMGTSSTPYHVRVQWNPILIEHGWKDPPILLITIHVRYLHKAKWSKIGKRWDVRLFLVRLMFCSTLIMFDNWRIGYNYCWTSHQYP